MANTYDPYQQTKDAVMPFWERARNNWKTTAADQGMLSSTGAMRRLSQDVEQPYAQAANTMYADLQKQARAEQFQQQQASTQNAMNLYNLLWSQYLNSWQLKGTDQGLRAPKDFPVFNNMYKAPYSQPLSTYMPQNVGDPNVEEVPRYSPNQGQTLDAKNSAASQAYQNAYLAYLKQRAAADDARWQAEFDAANGGEMNEDDQWDAIAADAFKLKMEGMEPDEIIKWLTANYNVDIMAAGVMDRRAQQILSALGISGYLADARKAPTTAPVITPAPGGAAPTPQHDLTNPNLVTSLHGNTAPSVNWLQTHR